MYQFPFSSRKIKQVDTFTNYKIIENSTSEPAQRKKTLTFISIASSHQTQLGLMILNRSVLEVGCIRRLSKGRSARVRVCLWTENTHLAVELCLFIVRRRPPETPPDQFEVKNWSLLVKRTPRDVAFQIAHVRDTANIWEPVCSQADKNGGQRFASIKFCLKKWTNFKLNTTFHRSLHLNRKEKPFHYWPKRGERPMFNGF